MYVEVFRRSELISGNVQGTDADYSLTNKCRSEGNAVKMLVGISETPFKQPFRNCTSLQYLLVVHGMKFISIAPIWLLTLGI